MYWSNLEADNWDCTAMEAANWYCTALSEMFDLQTSTGVRLCQSYISSGIHGHADPCCYCIDIQIDNLMHSSYVFVRRHGTIMRSACLRTDWHHCNVITRNIAVITVERARWQLQRPWFIYRGIHYNMDVRQYICVVNTGYRPLNCKLSPVKEEYINCKRLLHTPVYDHTECMY
jgi:hypothetical protein